MPAHRRPRPAGDGMAVAIAAVTILLAVAVAIVASSVVPARDTVPGPSPIAPVKPAHGPTIAPPTRD